MTAHPHRVQLRRTKGWRMPPNTIKVDRTTRFGNPFVVGVHGTRTECVRLFKLLLGGWVCLSHGKDQDGQWHADKQIAYTKMLRRNRRHLRGKNLACWCQLSSPCHADVLLEVANK